jgi:hypothetical protein
MKGVLAKIRYVFAVVVITGSAPNYFLLWFLWRGISLFLPQWKYQDGDDFLYSMYQRMVIFFFEHCTGQKVYLILFFLTTVKLNTNYILKKRFTSVEMLLAFLARKKMFSI